ncbi:hypothetical protein HPULCUR_007783 [Helicostylum pulchrum]|uniref:Uncharacterized protein n=1 Tax=Helicostylum pulchrum TaxID=562976 RepID=A0ABP9Y5R9_9FUNG
MGFRHYMNECFKNLKNSFHNYQAYASGYDAHEYVSNGNESGLKLHYYQPVVASSMQKLSPKEHKETFAWGVFALANFVCSKKKYIANYFCSKNTSSFNAYFVDEYDMKKDEDLYDEDDEYHYIDEYEADFLTAAIDVYGSDDEEDYMGLWSAEVYDTLYPQAITLDHSWGLIDSGDLSVEFQDTTLASKGPQKVVDLPLIISDRLL